VDSVPFRAAVFDRATVLVPLAVRASSISSLLVVKGGLGEAIAEVFELLWHRSGGDSPRSFTRQELAILTLMCEACRITDRKLAWDRRENSAAPNRRAHNRVRGDVSTCAGGKSGCRRPGNPVRPACPGARPGLDEPMRSRFKSPHMEEGRASSAR
jgi:hypothetical protein